MYVGPGLERRINYFFNTAASTSTETAGTVNAPSLPRIIVEDGYDRWVHTRYGITVCTNALCWHQSMPTRPLNLYILAMDMIRYHREAKAYPPASDGTCTIPKIYWESTTGCPFLRPSTSSGDSARVKEVWLLIGACSQRVGVCMCGSDYFIWINHPLPRRMYPRQCRGKTRLLAVARSTRFASAAMLLSQSKSSR